MDHHGLTVPLRREGLFEDDGAVKPLFDQSVTKMIQDPDRGMESDDRFRVIIENSETEVRPNGRDLIPILIHFIFSFGWGGYYNITEDPKK